MNYHKTLSNFKLKLKVFKYIYFSIISKNSEIILSFDDGPCGGTENILAILEKEQIPAIFFWTGVHFEVNKDKNVALRDKILSKNIIKIANHGYSHAFSQNYAQFYSHTENIIYDFTKNSELIGFNNTFCRLAGVNSWSRKNFKNNLDLTLKQNEFIPIGWDFTVDFNKSNSTAILKAIKRRLALGRTFEPNKIILLFHDWHFFQDEYNISELSTLIKLIKKHKNLSFSII